MTEITYITGDATSPVGAGDKIVLNVCNDIGAWGKGFVLALTKRWPESEYQYRRWFQDSVSTFKLGETRLQLVHSTDYLTWVANMIAQAGIFPRNGVPPIRYDALEACVKTCGDYAVKLGASIHMPRIGCGLAGGSWDVIEPIIQRQLCDRNIAVTVYDYVPVDANDKAYIPTQLTSKGDVISSERISELRA